MPFWDPMAKDFESHFNTLALNTKNYDSVSAGYIPKDEQTVCRFFSASGKCYKGMCESSLTNLSTWRIVVFKCDFTSGIKCDQLHVKPNADAFTEDKVEVCIDLPPFPLPAHGTMVCVQVVSVLSSCRFYAILPLGSRDLQDTFAETEEENLETMQVALFTKVAIQVWMAFSSNFSLTDRLAERVRWQHKLLPLSGYAQSYSKWYCDCSLPWRQQVVPRTSHGRDGRRHVRHLLCGFRHLSPRSSEGHLQSVASIHSSAHSGMFPSMFCRLKFTFFAYLVILYIW